MANTNCLEGFACPQCGSEGPFNISVNTMVQMFDDGSEDVPSDQEFGGDALCVCVNCDKEGRVVDFDPSRQLHYTVVLIEPDYLPHQDYGEGYYVGTTTAGTEAEAAEFIQEQARRHYLGEFDKDEDADDMDADDFMVVAVFQGRHRPWFGPGVSPTTDYPL